MFPHLDGEMARLNVATKPIYTHEGVKAQHIGALQQLRRSVLSCLLWESEFYEDGVSIAERITEFCKKVTREELAALAVDARAKFKLRHVPLLLVRELARKGGSIVGRTITNVIQRPDELSEFLSIYWKDGKSPLSAQVKLGLATAFRKFNEYQLAKYNRDGAIKLRDVLFLCHAKPKDEAQAALWKRLVNKELKTPDTWEVALSGGADKKATFERLMSENQLGVLAFLRNLRNMADAGISKQVVSDYSSKVNIERALPFRFIAAARALLPCEDVIEPMMIRATSTHEKLSCKTLLLIDTSPSMAHPLKSKSDLSRKDAELGVAVLCRELCSEVEIWAFSSECKMAPSRRGFALADAINSVVPSNGTLLGKAILTVSGRYDRLICITDEESQDKVRNPDGGRDCYLINVASNRNGIGYGPWTHIDGFSEAVVDYIREKERGE